MFFFRVVVLSLEFKTRDEVGLCSTQIDYKNRYAKKEKKKQEKCLSTLKRQYERYWPCFKTAFAEFRMKFLKNFVC